MAMLVVLWFLAFISSEAHAVQLIPQPTTSFVMEQGHGVILPFNYTLEQAENKSVLYILLDLNGSALISYTEFKGSIIDTTIERHLVGRPDVQILSSPQTYVGLLIGQTMLSDTGTYIWSIQIGGTKTSDSRMDLIVGNKPGSASLEFTHVGLVYTLTCTVTGGIPLPNVTILNGTEVINSSLTSPTTVSVTVEFPSVFYCVGTNVLGSTNDSLALPEPTTTMSPSTSTVTTTGDNTAFTTTKPPNKNQTRDNTGQTPTTAKDTGKPGNPNTALIVGVICGCVGGIVIIVILVCVYKKKKPKKKPGKKELTLEHRVVEGNDNTYALDENSTKLATEQEQEKKQQKNVKDRQYHLGPKGKTKRAGRNGRKKRVSNAGPNAEETEEQEKKQQLNVEGLQYADLDLRPTGKTKPAGGDGRNKLVFNDDSHVEYAEVRKV